MAHLSRREFTALAAAAAPFVLTRRSTSSTRRPQGPSVAASITAEDVIDRIKKNVGIEWRAETVDGVKAGDPSTAVAGIVTTSMAEPPSSGTSWARMVTPPTRTATVRTQCGGNVPPLP